MRAPVPLSSSLSAASGRRGPPRSCAAASRRRLQRCPDRRQGVRSRRGHVRAPSPSCASSDRVRARERRRLVARRAARLQTGDRPAPLGPAPLGRISCASRLDLSCISAASRPHPGRLREDIPEAKRLVAGACSRARAVKRGRLHTQQRACRRRRQRRLSARRERERGRAHACSQPTRVKGRASLSCVPSGRRERRAHGVAAQRSDLGHARVAPDDDLVLRVAVRRDELVDSARPAEVAHLREAQGREAQPPRCSRRGAAERCSRRGARAACAPASPCRAPRGRWRSGCSRSGCSGRRCPRPRRGARSGAATTPAP